MDDQNFFEASSVQVLVPYENPVGNLELLCTSGDGQKDDSADTQPLKQRSALFFDEILPVYIVLRTSRLDEARLRYFLKRLEIRLDIQAYGAAPLPGSEPNTPAVERSAARAEDLIWSKTLRNVDSDMIKRFSTSDSIELICNVWRMDAELNRPRIRLQSPKLDVKASMRLLPDEAGHASGRDPYLKSGVPASHNILEPLGQDPLLRGYAPVLKASRLSRFSLSDEVSDIQSPREIAFLSSFRATPVLSTRIHYTKPKNNAGKAALIAALDVETAPFSDDSVQIASVGMALSEGASLDLVSPHLNPGVVFGPRDLAVFLFRLTLNTTAVNTSSPKPAQTLDIIIEATVFLSAKSRAKIKMTWTTGVDFSAALNSSFGAPGQSMQRSRRPSSLAMSSHRSTASKLSATSQETAEVTDGSVAIPKTRPRATSVSDLGVTLTFTAPAQLRVGEPFIWDIMVYNGSRKSRQLILSAITGPAPAAPALDTRVSVEGDMAKAVIDEDTLYAMQTGIRGGRSAAKIICLDIEVQVGSLGPGACMDTNLRFLPLASGIVELDSVRVTDVVTGEAVDVRDLPDIIVSDEA